MKKTLSLMAIACGLFLCICVIGCTADNDSKKFLVGTYTSGGFGTMFDTVVYDEYTVTTDGRLIVVVKSGNRLAGCRYLATLLSSSRLLSGCFAI